MIGKLCLIFLVAAVAENSAATSKFVCYWGSWSNYRPGNGKFNVDNIDYTKCTHLVYTFMGVQETGTIYTLDDWLDNGLGMLNRFTGLKSNRSDLITLAAIGGWTQSTPFPTVAASPAARAELINSSIAFLHKYNFDGMDIDWEYPARRGGTEVDVQNFVTLLKEFREAFEPLGLLLSIAVSATPSTVAISYDVPAIAQYVDWLSVMVYDFHGSWETVTGHVSPLYPSSLDTTAESMELNVDICINNWIAQGAPLEKIVLGLALYGRSFTLDSPSNTSLGAPASRPGTAGPYTRTEGTLGYNEIIELRNQGGWTYVWDNEQQVPHIYKDNQWVGFEDPTSLLLKVKYAQSKKLGGVMVWSIETDDFIGLSGVKYQLLKTIQDELNGSSNSNDTDTTNAVPNSDASTRPVPSTAVSTTAVPTTANPNSYVCTVAGYFRDPNDCSKYYECVEENGTFAVEIFTCSGGLYFNEQIENCDWPLNVSDCI